MWHFLCASLFTRAAVADKMILLFEPQEMKLKFVSLAGIEPAIKELGSISELG